MQYICTAIRKGMVMATQRRYSVNLAPSGWAVYDNETGEKVKGFSGRSVGRIDALKYLYDLYGWSYPKGGKISPHIFNNGHIRMIYLRKFP